MSIINSDNKILLSYIYHINMIDFNGENNNFDLRDHNDGYGKGECTCSNGYQQDSNDITVPPILNRNSYNNR